MWNRSNCPHTVLRTLLWISQDPDLAGSWRCYTGSDGSIYDEHDRCALDLSNSWQSWWQNRQDTKTGVSRNHLSATSPDTSFHCQPLTEGTLAPGCFCDGLLKELLFRQCWWEVPIAFMCIFGASGIITHWYLHTACVDGEGNDLRLEDEVFTRTSHCKRITAWLQFNTEKQENLKAQWTLSLASSLKDPSIHI